jgi:HlyD family secretion protein
MKRPLYALLSLALVLPGCHPRGPLPDGSGTIECTQVEVAPQVGGRLLQLPPQEGAVLRRGDLVARIDPADFLLRRAEVQAALAQARAQLELLRAGARREDIARAQADLRGAKAAADLANADLRRMRELFEKTDATQQQLDAAQAHADRAAAALEVDEQVLARLLAGNRPEEIRVAEAQVEAAQAGLAIAEKAVADCTVAAPMDGVVTTRSREEGEIVSAGTPLITLSRLDEVWLSVYVPETKLAQVKLGQTARVKLDGEERMREGTVTFVAPEAEFTPKNVQTPVQRAKLVYRVKITLKNPDGALKPGLPADGYLTEVH